MNKIFRPKSGMARALDSDGIEREVELLVKRSKEFVYIISPYIRLSDSFKQALLEINDKNIEFVMVFRFNDIVPGELHFLTTLRNLEIRTNELVHAKALINERQVIISSMNLYEINKTNFELGVLAFEEDDAQLYHGSKNRINDIIINSTLFDARKFLNREPKLSKR